MSHAEGGKNGRIFSNNSNNTTGMKGKNLEATERILNTCIERSKSRFDLWIEYIKASKVESMAEIGVFKGEFAGTNDFEVLAYLVILPEAVK